MISFESHIPWAEFIITFIQLLSLNSATNYWTWQAHPSIRWGGQARVCAWRTAITETDNYSLKATDSYVCLPQNPTVSDASSGLWAEVKKRTTENRKDKLTLHRQFWVLGSLVWNGIWRICLYSDQLHSLRCLPLLQVHLLYIDK